MSMSTGEIEAYVTTRAQEGATYDQVFADLINAGAGVTSSMESQLQQMYTAAGGKTLAAPTTGVTYGNETTPIIDNILNKDSSDPTQSELFKAGGVNKLVGDNPWMSMTGAFGDKNTTGWVSPAIGLASSIGKGILGYKQLEETKKNNAEKLRLMEEANFMKKVQMKNRVNQANRYAMLGMGNANSQTATMSTVNRTPYTSMNLA